MPLYYIPTYDLTTCLSFWMMTLMTDNDNDNDGNNGKDDVQVKGSFILGWKINGLIISNILGNIGKFTGLLKNIIMV